MKNIFYLSILFVLIYTFNTLAQNVGIGTDEPMTKLDVNGALSLRKGADITISANDQEVEVGDQSYLSIRSNSGIKTFRIKNGLQEGQMLHLENANQGRTHLSKLLPHPNLDLLDNTCGVALGEGAYAVISFIWNGSLWKQMGRKMTPSFSNKMDYRFNCCSDNSSGEGVFVVPDNVTCVQVKLWGGGGRSSEDGTFYSYGGGGGNADAGKQSGGKGGGQNTGGEGGTCNECGATEGGDGTIGQGGNSNRINRQGGGGGGGFYGGGSGAGVHGGGGGGGSSYVVYLRDVVNQQGASDIDRTGASQSPPATDDPDYMDGAGVGGQVSGGSRYGKGGHVVIRY